MRGEIQKWRDDKKQERRRERKRKEEGKKERSEREKKKKKIETDRQREIKVVKEPDEHLTVASMQSVRSQ